MRNVVFLFFMLIVIFMIDANAQTSQVVVWNGETADKSAGLTTHSVACDIDRKSDGVRNGNTADEDGSFLIDENAITDSTPQSPALTEFGMFDNFSTETDYLSDKLSGRGLYWGTIYPEQTITRDYRNKQLLVKMTQKKWEYYPFGLSFGDSNGAAEGGDPYTIDLSGNGKYSFDITNKGTEGISVRVKCIDLQNREIDCSPGAANFGEIWKYQTQIIVLPGETVTMKAGAPNGAGGGILNTCNFTKEVWGDYTGGHVIRTDCDLKHIKSINLVVLNAAKDPNDLHALPLTDGFFAISNFCVGDTSALKASLPVDQPRK
jgi:hypothetical protein